LIRVARKGLQSRSATASLLIKNYRYVKEEIKLIAFLRVDKVQFVAFTLVPVSYNL